MVQWLFFRYFTALFVAYFNDTLDGMSIIYLWENLNCAKTHHRFKRMLKVHVDESKLGRSAALDISWQPVSCRRVCVRDKTLTRKRQIFTIPRVQMNSPRKSCS